MPRIGIDCRFAEAHAGLGTYTRELVSALLRRNDGTAYVLFCASDSPTWLPTGVTAEIIAAPFRHYSLAEQAAFPGLIAKAKPDLLFSPHFNVALRCPVPFVMTVHDLILHRFPNQAGPLKQLAYRAVMGSAVRRARAVIAVSSFTASEITSVYGHKAQAKTTVIHEAVSPVFRPVAKKERRHVLAKHGITSPYFLYVGNAKQHKNVQLLLDAYASLGSTETALVLLTGGKEAAQLRLPSGVRLLPDVALQDLPALYSGAVSFVSASLYEGFGLPLLESHACHCPAIVTNGSALAEIAPPGTALVPPTVPAFADAMQNPPGWQKSELVRGWEDVAMETVSVLMAAAR